MALNVALIDTHEADWVKQLTFGCAAVAIEHLEVGDLHLYADEYVIGVEHKQSDDLLNTLRDERLFPQLIRLREFTQWAYLAIAGTLQPGINGTCVTARRQSNWNWSSIAGALLTVEEIGCHIVWVPGDTDYEAAMVRLANRDRSALRVPPPRDSALLSEGETILAGLPGIGVDRAHLILRYAGSVASALAYLTDDAWTGPKAPGIGIGIKQKIRKALGLLEDETLNVTYRDGDIKRKEGAA